MWVQLYVAKGGVVGLKRNLDADQVLAKVTGPESESAKLAITNNPAAFARGQRTRCEPDGAAILQKAGAKADVGGVTL